MQEAWLLFDEAAIRKAAGNPNGRDELDLPSLRKIEDMPNPKQKLYELLQIASGLHGRRRAKLRLAELAPRVSEFIGDFAPLSVLPAFQALELEAEQVLREIKERQRGRRS